MIDSRTYYKQLGNMKKADVIRAAGYRNIKQAYRDLGDSHKLSKKYLARMIAF